MIAVTGHCGEDIIVINKLQVLDWAKNLEKSLDQSNIDFLVDKKAVCFKPT